MEYNYASPEHRLYDAAARWYPEPHWGGPADLIEAATQCLVEGLDSPSLRVLAGASADDRSEDLKGLLEAALDELSIPRPGELSPWRQVVAQGRTVSRAPTDSVRFEVRAVGESVGGHELLVFVNDVEMTRIGAGMGMDPFDVLIPTNRLVATLEPTRAPIARCDCGEHGCGSTDVTIVREGDSVHWDWLNQAPIDHGVTFRADQYDHEVARLAADHSWERPEDTTARLVLQGIDNAGLAAEGLKVSWAAKDHADHNQFKVALFAGNDQYDSAEAGYQVFLRVPCGRRSPQEVADDMLAELAKPPSKWRATWHSIKPGVTKAPPMASRRWRQERFGFLTP